MQRMEASAGYRVGVDIGGTFTDIVLRGTDGSIVTRKVLSTADDYARGIITELLELLQERRLPPAAIAGIVHATTIATNAILEKRGAKTALLTTRGFRDVLEFRRIRIPELYSLFYAKPQPLVPRRLRFEIEERMGPRGEVHRPLDEVSVTRALEQVRAAGVDALAICFLHAYANPSHERRAAEIVRAALPSLYVTCSADILPEIREYERTSTTVINAYVGPVVKRYLISLFGRLHAHNITAALRIMQSNGGVMTAEAAMDRPAYIVESGPAAGVIAAARVARQAGYANVITLDMGGTTAKSSIIENGQIVKTSEHEVGAGINLSSRLVKGGGHALKLPLIDVSEIGAGGGSVVWIDKGGLLQIGPRSAGAMPGPVCYDTGGEEPTLADAQVVLGYINPHYLAGGRVRLNADKARRVLEEGIANPLRKPLLETAYGIHVIASATMMRAVKAVSTYRGRDPRDFVLLAFGGNGPVCAVELARALQMKRVLVPPYPGLFSALGLLLSNPEYEFVQTYFRRAADLDLADLNQAFATLEDQAGVVVAQEGYGEDHVRIARQADLRYSGQAYELTVPVPAGRLSATDVDQVVEAFEQEHLQTYGHRAIDESVHFVNIHVIGSVSGTQEEPGTTILAPPHHAFTAGERLVCFGPEHGLLPTPVIARGNLSRAARPGPLIIEEYDATCVVPPGSRASLDIWNNIVIDVG